MEKIHAILLYFFTIVFLASITTTISIRFVYPELTETQLFLKFWYLIPINTFLAGFIIYLLKK